jgi:hypothetical protein
MKTYLMILSIIMFIVGTYLIINFGSFLLWLGILLFCWSDNMSKGIKKGAF